MEIVILYIIPFLVSGVIHYFYKKEISIIESVCMFILPTLIVGIIHLLMYKFYITDHSTNLKLVHYVEYYEPYETYVDKTCESCSKDSKGNETCYTYDCSYCDDYSEEYNVVFYSGGKRSISSLEYDDILSEYNPSKPKFYDLKRRINKHGSCGFDGDKYITMWNGKIENSITKYFDYSYDNPILLNKNAYHFSEEKIDNNYLYNNVQGLELLKISQKEKEVFKRYVYYENSLLSDKNGGQFYIHFTKESIDFAVELKRKLLNGKNNQLYIVVGVDDNNKINYVYPFSWSLSKKEEVNIKYEMMKLVFIDNPNKLVKIIKKNMQNFKVRDMQDFNYLSYEMSGWRLITLYIVMVILSFGISIYCITNLEKY